MKQVFPLLLLRNRRSLDLVSLLTVSVGQRWYEIHQLYGKCSRSGSRGLSLCCMMVHGRWCSWGRCTPYKFSPSLTTVVQSRFLYWILNSSDKSLTSCGLNYTRVQAQVASRLSNYYWLPIEKVLRNNLNAPIGIFNRLGIARTQIDLHGLLMHAQFLFGKLLRTEWW